MDGELSSQLLIGLKQDSVQTYTVSTSRVVNFPQISGKLSEAWEVITSIIFIRIS